MAAPGACASRLPPHTRLPKAERLDECRAHAARAEAQRGARVGEVREAAQRGVNVVGVRVARDGPRSQGLERAVDHPRGGRALRVARQVLLRDDEERAARRAAEVRELRVRDVRLVDVVCERARA